MTGEWPTIGRIPNWDRENWPVPKFIRRDPLTKHARLISYADDDPNLEIAAESCSFDAAEYEEDSLWGSGLTEIVLTKLLTNTLA